MTKFNNMSYFFLYQPYYFNNKIIGYEALIREKKGRIILFPYDFISKYDVDNHYYIINLIFDDIRRKKNLQKKQISINIPARFISNNIDFSRINVKSIDLDLISFEISESDAITDYIICNRNIKYLKNMGCKIAIDDFGIGYSNFKRLTRITVDIVKIDISLIKGISLSKIKYSRLEQIIKKIKHHNKNIIIIGEGIESISDFNTIKKIGISYFQGYLFSKPIFI